ncbi:hypothetical protein [Haloplanus salilacus]|uniref:hypothetical protein n=1 Tax=Haloplanus salilacus TaxID=2949994 RepID=UPI0030D0401A
MERPAAVGGGPNADRIGEQRLDPLGGVAVGDDERRRPVVSMVVPESREDERRRGLPDRFDRDRTVGGRKREARVDGGPGVRCRNRGWLSAALRADDRHLRSPTTVDTGLH